MTKVVDVTALSLAQLEAAADQLEAAGRNDDLAAVLKQLKTLRPGAAGLLFRLGRALIAIGDAAGAEDALVKYIALQKTPDSTVHGLLGTALVAQQKYAQALAPLHAAVTREQN